MGGGSSRRAVCIGGGGIKPTAVGKYAVNRRLVFRGVPRLLSANIYICITAVSYISYLACGLPRACI